MSLAFSLHGHRVVFDLPDPTDLIQRKILESKSFYELELLEDMRARLRPGGLCVDVGAHLGNHTLFLAKVCGMRVLAFEPQPALYQLLVKHVELNGLQDRVRTFNCALGSVPARGVMTRLAEGNTGAAALSFREDGPVEVSTLDHHIGDEVIDLIKVDVEGHELEVLEGAHVTVARDKPLIYAEAATSPARKALQVFLGARGYATAETFGSTPVVSFVHCVDEADRVAVLANRVEAALTRLDEHTRERLHDQRRSVRKTVESVTTANRGIEARLERLERAVDHVRRADIAPLSEALERIESAGDERSALLYELWNLGIQSYERVGDHAAAPQPYVALNDGAMRLKDWKPTRKRWTVPNGTDAGAFLQGYASRIAARPGDSIDFHLSTNRAPLFAKVRIFGIADRMRRGLTELYVSPPLSVPKSGVWQPSASGRVDERAWPRVHTVRLGKNWRPGCYVARIETIEGHAFLHPFWVTSRQPESRMLRLCPTITHYMRNRWQGPTRGGLFRSGSSVARFPRPFGGSRGGEALRNELPLFRWANANAVAMDCHVDLQVHRDPSLLDAYDHVVLAGDCRYLTRPLLDALRAFRDRGGSITVFGAAPGEHEVTVDVEAQTIAKVAHSGHERAAWRAANEALWGATRYWSNPDEPLDLEFTERGRTSVLADSDFSDPVRVERLCSGRLSGTDLPAGASTLLARTVGGKQSADVTLETTEHGARVFVAGTDRWTTLIDDQFNHSGVRDELAYVTAQLLGASGREAVRQPLVSVIMTAYESESFIARAVESVLGQSYEHLELIIVDDNSQDGTFEALLALAARDHRIRPYKSFRNSGTYWCKNYGLSKAHGEFATFQDSDDTSLPERLAEQVQALRWDESAIGVMVDYERRTEAGELVLNRGLTQRRCFPSLMFRRDQVVERMGFFDSVRTSADQEFVHRMRLVFGADSLIEIRRPLYQALVRDGSLTRSDGGGVSLDADDRSHLSETRLRYVESFERWHKQIDRDGASPFLAFPIVARPFDAPPSIGVDGGRSQVAGDPATAQESIASFGARTLATDGDGELSFTVEPLPDAPDQWHRVVGLARPERAAEGAGRTYDVILMSDFRFAGGTSQSNAAEIAAQARAGLVTGLVHVPSPVLKRSRSFHPAIRELIETGAATLLSAHVRSTCRLLVVRHPSVLEGAPDELPDIRADELVVVVNQAPTDQSTGQQVYDMARCQEHARQRFGSPGTWFPIGPLVRETVATAPGSEHLADVDWGNIIDIDEWGGERTGFVGDVPVIGRHSRATPDKWPADRETLLAAYPEQGVRVRVLGGAAPVVKLLGALPANWEVLAFGAEEPRAFLQTIDFLVYFHHPSLVEAFGRTILEALAAGVPAIVPHHFKALFEDVAVYAEPAEVAGIVQELYADPARYRRISAAGIEFARRRFSYAAHVGRVTRLLGDHAHDVGADESADSGTTPATSPEGTLETVYLEPDAVYKFGFELSGATESTRGRLRGICRRTGRDLVVVPIEGAVTGVSQFAVNGEQRAQVDIVAEVDAGTPFVVDKVRVRRRADRPKQPALNLTDTSVTAALATYPGRRDIAPAVIESLASQVDRLFVYLNNYDDVPAFIRDSPLRDRIAFVLDPTSQLRAAAKFHWLDTVPGYHLVCDDDILYPPDYAARMVAAIDEHGRDTIVGVHGVVFERELVDARTSRRHVFKFPAELGVDTPVHFLGTGTVALHTSVLSRMDTARFRAFPIANDEILAVSAKHAGVPLICISREADWLTPHPDVSFGIFEERQLDGGEHDKATELLVEANPWPEPGARR